MLPLMPAGAKGDGAGKSALAPGRPNGEPEAASAAPVDATGAGSGAGFGTSVTCARITSEFTSVGVGCVATVADESARTVCGFGRNGDVMRRPRAPGAITGVSGGAADCTSIC